VTVLFDVPPARINLVRALGWVCSAPIVDPVGSRVFCGRRLPMEPGDIDPFLITVQTGPEPTLTVQVEADTRSVDTDAGNNAAEATVGVKPPL